jgi:hypothetical protein
MVYDSIINIIIIYSTYSIFEKIYIHSKLFHIELILNLYNSF